MFVSAEESRSRMPSMESRPAVGVGRADFGFFPVVRRGMATLLSGAGER